MIHFPLSLHATGDERIVGGDDERGIGALDAAQKKTEQVLGGVMVELSRGLVEAGKKMQQRRLSAAGRTDERDAITALDPARRVFQRHHSAAVRSEHSARADRFSEYIGHREPFRIFPSSMRMMRSACSAMA